MDRSGKIFKPMHNRFLFDTLENFSILIYAIYNNYRCFYAAHFFFRDDHRELWHGYGHVRNEK